MSKGEKKAKTADERSLDIKCYIKKNGGKQVRRGEEGAQLYNHSKRNQTTKPVTEQPTAAICQQRGAETQAGKDRESDGEHEEQTHV